MYGGTLGIDIQTPTQYDEVAVGGQAKLGGTLFARFVGGLLNTDFRPGDRIEFMTYDSRDGDFSTVVKPVGWGPDKTNKKYWLQQIGGVAGRVRNDADGDGVFEPANGETVLAGVTVELLDADDTVVETTTSAADGSYLFDELGIGDWKVRFTRPAALRPVAAGQGSDPTLDSDYDYGTLLAAVTLTEANPTATKDALFRPLTAVADEFHTTSGATISGNVALNDPPAFGDTLTFALAPGSGPAAGVLDFHADGTFTYTAPSVSHGSPTVAVTFQYVVTDSYGHTATATVTIYVAPFWDDGGPGDPPPPP